MQASTVIAYVNIYIVIAWFTPHVLEVVDLRPSVGPRPSMLAQALSS